MGRYLKNILIKYNFCRFICVSMSIFILLFLTGCNNIFTEIDPAQTVQTEGAVPVIEDELPQVGGEIRVPLSAPYSLNPLFAETKWVSDFLGLIFEPLFIHDTNMRPVPKLASSWEVMHDGMVWRIELKSGIRFSDGQELTAEDVVFTFLGIREATAELSPQFNELNLNTNIETIIADENNPYVFNIYLFEPVSNMLNLLTFPILPSHLFQSDVFTQENLQNLAFLPVGTGPFMLSSAAMVGGQLVRLERNPYFHGNKPYLDSIIGVVFENETLARTAFRDGQLDVLDTDRIFADSYAIGRNAAIHSYVTQNFEFIGFNYNNAALADIQVRRALAYAIDRQWIIKNVYNGHAQEVNAPIPPNSWLYRSLHGTFVNDPKLAVELLENAGFRNFNEEGIRFKVTETGIVELKFRLAADIESNLRRHTAQIISEQLKPLGIAIELQFLQSQELEAALLNNDFEMYLAGTSVSNPPSLEFEFSFVQDTESILFRAFENNMLIELANEAKIIDDDERLSEIYISVQRVFSEQLPILSLYFRSSSVLLSEGVKGITLPFGQNIFSGIERWFLAR